ncbi:MAG: restriction endonuclease subunit S [Flavobacteriales bacterium]|nr:restriction endonuclease subunit S [Flavobacteriales bacterium]
MEELLEKTHVLPKGWRCVQLGDVLSDIIGGGTPSRDVERYWNGDIPWITVKDMRTRRPEAIQEHITEAGVNECATNIIPADTVITATRVGLGKVVRVPYPAAINQDLKALITGPELDKDYLEWWIISQANYIESIGSGTTVKGIRLNQLKELEIPLAPLPQQRRIVEAIELQLGRLDAAVARLQGAKARLKRYKQAVLKAAVEGANVANEETLGTLSELVTSGSRGWADYYADSGDIFIRAQNLKHDVLDLSDIAYVQLPAKVDGLRTQVMKHDILITITGANVTKTALVEHDIDGRAFVNQHVALVRLKDPTQAPFVYRWLISPAHGRGFLEKLAYGAGKPGLNLSNIRDLSIPLPSVADQEAAVARLNEIDAVNNELETTLDAQLQQAGRLRQAVLKRAFEGRLV